jgi:hypothetical protein
MLMRPDNFDSGHGRGVLAIKADGMEIGGQTREPRHKQGTENVKARTTACDMQRIALFPILVNGLVTFLGESVPDIRSAEHYSFWNGWIETHTVLQPFSATEISPSALPQSDIIIGISHIPISMIKLI